MDLLSTVRGLRTRKRLDSLNASDPITMTATDGNEQQGWWRGIAFYSSNANNTLNLVEVRHGGITDMSGISDPANVALDDGAILTLSNSAITDSGGAGIYCNNSESSLTETGNSFNNNDGQNVANCQ